MVDLSRKEWCTYIFLYFNASCSLLIVEKGKVHGTFLGVRRILLTFPPCVWKNDSKNIYGNTENRSAKEACLEFEHMLIYFIFISLASIFTVVYGTLIKWDNLCKTLRYNAFFGYFHSFHILENCVDPNYNDI